MVRPLSAVTRRAIFSQETGEVFVILLSIRHADLTETIRVCSDSRNLESRGETYLACPFRAALPSEQEGELARVRLMIDNVERRIVEAVRTISSAPSVTLEVVLASHPDVVEAGPFEFALRDVSYDELTVEGELSFENVLNEPYPEGIFSPADFPGIF